MEKKRTFSYAKMRRLVRAGLSRQQLAGIMGVTKQRIYQILPFDYSNQSDSPMEEEIARILGDIGSWTTHDKEKLVEAIQELIDREWDVVKHKK